MIDIDELQQAWNGLNAQFEQRLQQQDAQLRALQRRSRLDAVRARLRLMTLGQWAQLGIGLAIVLWAGGYWVDRLSTPHLAAYGIALHGYGLALLVAAVLQLVALARVDYRLPVLQVQQRLLLLRRLRIRSEAILLPIGMLMWVPVLFIGFNALGQDIWAQRPSIVGWNLAVGLLLAIATVALMRRFRAYFERDAAGRSLREAEAELDELSRDATPRG